jgi:hypothetical protein
MSTLKFMVQSIKENHVLTDFVLDQEERDRIWAGIRAGLKGPQPGVGPKGYDVKAHERMLREHFEHLLSELEKYLERNRQAPPQDADEDDVFTPTPHNQQEGASKSVWHQRNDSYFGAEDGIANPDTTPTARRGVVRSSVMAIDTSVAAPYNMRPGEGMESPTETGGSPEEAPAPMTPEEDEEAVYDLVRKFNAAVLADDFQLPCEEGQGQS